MASLSWTPSLLFLESNITVEMPSGRGLAMDARATAGAAVRILGILARTLRRERLLLVLCGVSDIAAASSQQEARIIRFLRLVTTFMMTDLCECAYMCVVCVLYVLNVQCCWTIILPSWTMDHGRNQID